MAGGNAELLSAAAVYLGATVVAVPLFKRLKLGSVLGYLTAGVLIGPHALNLISDADSALKVSEFGVVLLLFVIGLELKPSTLIRLRYEVFGLGAAQVICSGLVIGLVAGLTGLFGLGLDWRSATVVGAGLALSSTAFAVQILREKNDLATPYGQRSFAVLLFQDLAIVPLIAMVGILAPPSPGAEHAPIWYAALQALAAIGAVYFVGRYALKPIFTIIAEAHAEEVFAAAALLVVVASALAVDAAGLSMALGAFLAGVLLAESAYRHQLETDIEPFRALLMGLFFIAVGMTLNLTVFQEYLGLILASVVVLAALKIGVLYALALYMGSSRKDALRIAATLSQGGEFAFVLFTVGYSSGALTWGTTELLTIVVTLSMAATPIALKIESFLSRRGRPAPEYETPPDNDGHVVIAGFGRFGQIVARILTARRIPFTALDIDVEQVEIVRRFGSQAFYGDASRPEILEAADTDEARAFVLAIDDVEASIRTAQLVRERYPDLPIYARARNRAHAHRLIDVGVTYLQRATFLSAVDVGKQLLKGLGVPEREAERVTHTFRTHDERRLVEDYQHASDIEKLRERARSDIKTLEKLFEEDAAEEARLRAAAKEEDD